MMGEKQRYSKGSVSFGGDVVMGDKIQVSQDLTGSVIRHIPQETSTPSSPDEPEIQKLLDQLRVTINMDEGLTWEQKGQLAEVVEDVRYEFSVAQPDLEQVRRMLKGTLIPVVGDAHLPIKNAARAVLNYAVSNEAM
jgi:uncharacterized protein YpuA (DUF1002 family)